MRKAETILIIFLTITTIATQPFISIVAKAQPQPQNVETLGPLIICSAGDSLTNVKISSPQNQSCLNNPIQLNFSVTAVGMFKQFGNIGYSLDSGIIESITNFINKSVEWAGPDWYWNRTTVFANINLPTLSDGVHNATVYYGWQYLGTNNPDLERFEIYAYATVSFTVGNLAQTENSIPKPSIPEFTVKLLTSYAENTSTIQFTIKNQPFDKSLNRSLYYNIRYRINGSNWKEVYRPDDGFPSQSHSNYTILEFSSSNEYDGYFLDTSTSPPWSFTIIAPNNSILDVQAKAMIGYIHRVPNSNFTSQLDMYPYVFSGETSDWSNTQTITIPISSQPENPTPNQSTNPPNNSTANQINMYEIIVTLIVIIGITAITATLLAYFKKHKSA
ncbi:MAG TPA: hypothetical protein VK209_12225 [Candidatus Sulfotelmatobacter sp.]|nr:hypothetical protein [Candidatus Sulfotelmatobacter sp.]